MEKLWSELKDSLQNYCKNNGFQKVIFGLSGGLDSAVVSVLASQALGSDKVLGVMMKTKYTSEQSIRIAREIAQLNSFNYRELDIQSIIDSQKGFLIQAFTEEPKNIVLENLQARERGKILMAFSNQYGYLVLACGNKSEIAMGYCTLYGDTCGGISPIGNIYKSKIFELAKWLNRNGKVLPEEVISRAPSAELSLGQKDEDSLPPYAVLDVILSLYCDEKKTKEDILTLGFDEKMVSWIINQYHKMEFKRKQLPPSL